MKRYAVRIQEGSRPHLRLVRAACPDDAAREVIRQLNGGPEHLLGAKIAVWEHGKLQRNPSPLFIKSVEPYETTPDIHVVQAIREELRRARWLEKKARVDAMKELENHQFEEPFKRWIEAFEATPGANFFELSAELRHDCQELRERLKHVSPGDMTAIQAKFAGIVTGFGDLHRYEMHAIQEHLSETLEMIHHRLAGLGDEPHAATDDVPAHERLANLIGLSVRASPERATAAL
jgi:hypothetical protein